MYVTHHYFKMPGSGRNETVNETDPRVKIGTTHYLNHYSTAYFSVNEYRPHRCKDGREVWRYCRERSSGWTPTQLAKAGIEIKNYHNQPVTPADAK